jgi:ElaA protein
MDLRQHNDELVIQCLPFDQLDTYTLYDMLALRMSVFCVEQNCPYQDADGQDQNAWHVLAYHNGTLVGVCRILMPGIAYPDACSIGRVANSSDFRGKGFGKSMMANAVKQCEVLFPKHPIRIGAQRYLAEFYQQFGFAVISEPYLEDGIVHVSMVKPAIET